jgi:hypothetical protein
MSKSAANVVLAIALVMGTASMALPANATTIDWTLVGVTFDDGGTASGTFSTDSTTGFVTAFDITTTTGFAFGGATYNTTTSYLFSNNFYSPNSFIITTDNTTVPFLNLAFVNPLTALGVDDLVLTGWDNGLGDGSFECGACTQTPDRSVDSGVAVSTTPLPAALPMFGIGLGALGLLGWRRKRKAQVAV